MIEFCNICEHVPPRYSVLFLGDCTNLDLCPDCYWDLLTVTEQFDLDFMTSRINFVQVPF